jgi:hypothetical protein
MILKDQLSIARSRKIGQWLKPLSVILIAVSILLILWLVVSPNNKVRQTPEGFVLVANAEEKEGDFFQLNEAKVSGAAYQSKEQAFEGQYSMKLQNPGEQYGFRYILDDIHKGQIIKARVWTYSDASNIGCLIISDLDGKEFANNCFSVEEKDGWRLIEVAAIIQEQPKDHKIKIFCFNGSENPVYFDQLSYQLLDQKEAKLWEPDQIQLVLKEGNYKKLEQKRDEAIKKGLIITSDDSWVNGYIYPQKKEEDKIKIALRLKGDWTDHLRGESWSFRVETESTKAWKRLKTFSLQHPRTRNYLKEWLLHQLFKYEDVLTTRYDFVEVQLNEKDLGMYVYEEHFLKQIPEYNLKREGPIIKFTEEGFWESRLHMTQENSAEHLIAHKNNPDIKPFKEKKTFKSPALAKQYSIAQNLLYEYQFGLKKPDEIFDLDLLAKYFVLNDLMGSHHGVVWHNQRFYYNPVIGKLEAIGFDGFGGLGPSWVKLPFIGGNLSSVDYEDKWHNRLFQDQEFLDRYYNYLHQYSQKEYIDSFIQSIKPDLDDRLMYLKAAFPDYKFDLGFLYKRAADIRFSLIPNNTSIQTRTVEEGVVAVCNLHTMPIYLIGSTAQKDGILNKFDEAKLVLTSPRGQLKDFSQQFEVPEKAKFLVYQVLGDTKKHYVEISPWPVPEAFSPVQELEPNLQKDHPAYYYDEANKKVIFKRQAQITKEIIIPKEHSVFIEEGSQLDIKEQAFVLSYSAVQFMGSEENPILVTSSDKTARGFTVLKADQTSNINYTRFEDMNTLNYKGWVLTGAVTFYESDVNISNSVFTQNSCEDALNIIRSHFLFSKSIVSHTYSDGFDADFCTGKVEEGYFYKTGNDGIDFSTSNITIKDTRIDSVGDKGISIGEEGVARVINCTIDGAVIGIASKDLSRVTVESVTLKNCKEGFSAYQKKPEYGGGFLFVKDYSAENVKSLYKIFPDSYLKLKGQEIKGD